MLRSLLTNNFVRWSVAEAGRMDAGPDGFYDIANHLSHTLRLLAGEKRREDEARPAPERPEETGLARGTTYFRG